MSDQELLELAAKAYGLQVKGWVGDRLVFFNPITQSAEEVWSPLTDDGDALRLAVKLRLCVSVEHDAAASWWAGDSLEQFNEPLMSDDNYAVRRVIVRAAADIGRAKP